MLASPRAYRYLQSYGWERMHESEILEIWEHGDNMLYIHQNGAVFLYPVRDTEIDARRFKVRSLVSMLMRYSR